MKGEPHRTKNILRGGRTSAPCAYFGGVFGMPRDFFFFSRILREPINRLTDFQSPVCTEAGVLVPTRGIRIVACCLELATVTVQLLWFW